MAHKKDNRIYGKIELDRSPQINGTPSRKLRKTNNPNKVISSTGKSH